MKQTGINIRGRRADPDGIVEKRVREIAQTWETDTISTKWFNAHLIAAVIIAASAYAHTPIDVQVHIAVFTLLTISVDDLDIDSLSMVEIAVQAEDRFGVKIPDEQLAQLKTVSDAVDYIAKNQ